MTLSPTRAEPTYAQQQHLAAIDLAVGELVGVVRRALAGNAAAADGVVRQIGTAIQAARALILAD